MEIIECTQGDETWHAARAKHYCASDAAAMLGLSKYKSRNELLRRIATGIEADNNGKQWLFDKGHAAEAAALPLVESQLQESLFPVVGTLEVDGLPLLASFDGINIETTLVWECKLWSAEIEAMIQAGEIAETHWPQLEQQLLVSGAERVLFTGCDGEQIKGQLWYVSNPERRARLIAGWKQIEEDVANYQPIEQPPAIVVAPIDDLPALTVELVGQVTSSNLALFKSAALARIESINTDLQTDEDFAVAKKTVKFLDDGEKRLVLVKQQALSQTASIDELFRTMDALREEMKAKRLTLDKLVTAREASIKIEIMQAGKDALAVHIATLNKRLATVQMPPIVADFATAIKGKRNLESMRGAVDDLVAAKKIESNAIADKIQINLATLDEAKEYGFLFSDRAALVMKESDDLALIIRSRIADHKSAEEKRLAEEREKMRKEEEAKAEAKIKAEQAESQRKAAAEAAAKIEADRKEFAAPPAQTAASLAQPEPAVTAASHANSYARMRDRLDELAQQMTERELSDLCIHAQHIIFNRKEAA